MHQTDFERFGFTTADTQSPLWRKFMRMFEHRIEHHRRRNDGDLDPVKTAKVRGQIAEATFYQGLDKPTPPVADDS